MITGVDKIRSSVVVNGTLDAPKPKTHDVSGQTGNNQTKETVPTEKEKPVGGQRKDSQQGNQEAKRLVAVLKKSVDDSDRKMNEQNEMMKKIAEHSLELLEAGGKYFRDMQDKIYHLSSADNITKEVDSIKKNSVFLNYKQTFQLEKA